MTGAGWGEGGWSGQELCNQTSASFALAPSADGSEVWGSSESSHGSQPPEYPSDSNHKGDIILVNLC